MIAGIALWSVEHSGLVELRVSGYHTRCRFVSAARKLSNDNGLCPLGSEIGLTHANCLSKRLTALLKMCCGLFGDYPLNFPHSSPLDLTSILRTSTKEQIAPPFPIRKSSVLPSFRGIFSCRDLSSVD